jgi:hypothetical protein
MDICSDNSHRDGVDTVDRHRDPTMNRQQWIASLIIIALILIGNLGGILWALSW